MKKFTLMLLGLSFLITACGGEKEATTKKTDEAATIKIGGLGPLTGPLAIYGVTATNGSKLAFEEINKNGGILGKQVEFVLFDEKGDSTEAVTAYNRLVDEGVVALVGDITSKPSLAVAEIAAQDNMPMITPTGTQFNITEAGPNVFRVCFTDPYQGVILANLAKNNLKANTVAIMVNNSSDYSDGVAEAFIKEAERLGLKIVAKEGYAEGDKDFRAQLTKVAATNPDVLLVPDYYEQVALITTQAREVGVKSTFIGPDGWDGVAKALEPSAFSALSYDAAYLMKDAIEKAGSTDKDAIVKAMKESDFAGVTGHLRFDEKNNPVKAVTVLKVVNGNYTFDSVIQPE